MGTDCVIVIEAEDQGLPEHSIEVAVRETHRFDRRYSHYDPSSLVSLINRRAGNDQWTELDEEADRIFGLAQQVHQASDHMFDPSVAPLTRLWDHRAQRLPSGDQIKRVRQHVGFQRVLYQAGRVMLPAGMALEFGGLVKEYAVDAIAVRLVKLGVQHALIDLGGDMRAIGQRLGGQPWTVGVRDPNQPDKAIASIDLKSCALATSGTYFRSFSVGGQRYSHLINPQTGSPVVDNLASVSVCAPNCTVAGIAATLTLLKPAAQALQELQALEWAWVAVDSEGGIHRS
ncbi:MAG: FAD:protein FMN transferase [Lysobacteraceae bacterium]|nr:MAG: FAD:protein FMN transferase [Xanthomonadaceae bacterium]